MADGIGYIPNAAARSLISQLTHTFGLITPDVTDPIHGQIVTGFHERASALGYSVILANGYWDPDTERDVFETFASRRVDGVVTMGTSLRPAEVIEMLNPTPVIFIEPENGTLGGPDKELLRGCIETDDFNGLRQIAEHLLSRGYEAITYLSGKVPGSQLLRRYALIEILAEMRRGTASFHVLEEEGHKGFLAAAEALRDQEPDAVVCYDDKTALNLMDAFRTVGVSVPTDVAIVGFDDIPFARIANPRLTTVAQPAESIAEMAADMLAVTHEEGEVPPSVSVPAELIVRETTPDRNSASTT